jgi:hypothetical protein
MSNQTAVKQKYTELINNNHMKEKEIISHIEEAMTVSVNFTAKAMKRLYQQMISLWLLTMVGVIWLIIATR